MASIAIKLRILAVHGCQSGPRTEVAIILTGDPSLSELINASTIEGTVSTVQSQYQAVFQAIRIKIPVVGNVLDRTQQPSDSRLDPLNSLGRVLIFHGEHPAALPTHFPETDGSDSVVFLKFSRARSEDVKIARYRAILLPRSSPEISNTGATLIVSIEPYQPNQMLLLGWLARQEPVPGQVGWSSAPASDQNRTERETVPFENRMQHYTAMLLQDGPYAPKDDIAGRTGMLISDLDRLMMRFQKSK